MSGKEAGAAKPTGVLYADGHMRCRRCDYQWMPRIKTPVKKCPRCYRRLDMEWEAP